MTQGIVPSCLGADGGTRPITTGEPIKELFG
jgi:hypothetical protein